MLENIESENTQTSTMNNNDLIKAAKGEFSANNNLPIWIMKLAGPYLPEFEEFRRKDDYFDICQNPEVASEVTILAVKKYELDSALIFSDISVIPKALGMEVEMKSGVGPFLPTTLTSENVTSLISTTDNNIVDRLKYIGEIIKLTKEKLQGKVPLMGFSESPLTIMSYMIEGSSQFFKPLDNKTKKFLIAHPKQSVELLDKLTDIVVDYLVMQVEAGADILQVFDNSLLIRSHYIEFSLPFLGKIRKSVREKLNEKNVPQVPMILFTKNVRFGLNEIPTLGYEIISLNWRAEPQIIRSLLRTGMVTVQENVDQVVLSTSNSFKDFREVVTDLTKQFPARRFVFNLGLGMHPDADLKPLQTFVDVVHSIPHKCC